MKQVELRFYAELNDFLPPHRRQVTFGHHIIGRVPVKQLIESLGVPHTEIDFILVNGKPVDFSYTVQEGDRISVYPVFESFDITPIGRLRPRPLRQTRFVLDVSLGRLAVYLRLLGFDTLYHSDVQDDELVRIAGEQRRIILTQSRSLLQRKPITHGYLVRATDPRQQLVEVVCRFDLRRAVQPF